MIRTQVYLDEKQAGKIRLLAASTRKSQSEIIRQALEQGIKQIEEQTPGNASAFLELAALADKLNLTGPTDLSTNHDDYLYGDKN